MNTPAVDKEFHRQVIVSSLESTISDPLWEKRKNSYRQRIDAAMNNYQLRCAKKALKECCTLQTEIEQKRDVFAQKKKVQKSADIELRNKLYSSYYDHKVDKVGDTLPINELVTTIRSLNAINAIQLNQRKSVKPWIRWMISRDIFEVIAISNDVLREAISEEKYRKILRARNHLGLVAEYEERVIGFVMYEIRENCIHVLYELADPNLHEASIRTALDDKLQRKISLDGRKHLFHAVHETDLPRQLDLQSKGYGAVEIVGDRYLMQYPFSRT